MKARHPYIDETLPSQSPGSPSFMSVTTDKDVGRGIINKKLNLVNPSVIEGGNSNREEEEGRPGLELDEAKDNKSLSFSALKRIIKKVGFF
jgi:hypothetical protein